MRQVELVVHLGQRDQAIGRLFQEAGRLPDRRRAASIASTSWSRVNAVAQPIEDLLEVSVGHTQGGQVALETSTCGTRPARSP